MIDSVGSSATSVTIAIERASAKTGTSFDYLLKTAAQESSLDPSAHAGTSSAAGLFQFIESTWYGMIKNYGDKHGLGTYAAQIQQGKNGRYYVADPQVRREILALRYDPEIAATMAGEYTKESQVALKSVLGREPNGGELYAAHFLGSDGAIQLVQAVQNGDPSAADLFPDAARANRSIFYTKGGVARSASQVLAQLQNLHDDVDIPKDDVIANGVMLAQIRGSIDNNDNVVSKGYVPSSSGRPASDSEDAPNYLPPNDLVYTAANQPQVVTPFMAQLLASLDPIPDRARDVLFQVDREAEHKLDEAA